MKKILIASMLAVFALASYAEVEKKKVCHKEVVKGKEIEKCKEIKIHKKLEGTAVPEKKK
jgi:hypothetical protein